MSSNQSLLASPSVNTHCLEQLKNHFEKLMDFLESIDQKDAVDIEKGINPQPIIFYYNLSILRGEYYDKESITVQKKLKSILQSLLEKLKNFREEELRELNDKQRGALDIIRYEIHEYLKFNTHLGYLIVRIKERLSQSAVSVIDIEYEQELEEVYYKLKKDYLKKKSADFSFVVSQTIPEPPTVSDFLPVELDRPTIKISNSYFLFLVSIKLAEIDEGYVCNNKTRNDLLRLSVKLRFATGHEDGFIALLNLASLLESKCDYLINKMLCRLSKDGEKCSFKVLDTEDEFDYNIENLRKSLKDSVFKDLNKLTENHYLDKDRTFNTHVDNDHKTQCYDACSSTPGNSVEAIHYCCKHVKLNLDDIINDRSIHYRYNELVSVFENLSNRLRQGIPASNEDPNALAYKTSHALVSNILFKLKSSRYLHASGSSIVNLEGGYQALKDLYESFILESPRFENYFIHRYFCDVVFKIIEVIEKECNKLPERVPSDLNLFVYELFKDYQNANNRYKDSLAKAETEMLMPVYLFMHECFIDTKIRLEKDNDQEEPEELDIAIFLDGAYIAPINFRKLYRDNDLSNHKLKAIEANIFAKILKLQNDNRLSELSAETEQHKKDINEKFQTTSKELEKEMKAQVKDSQASAISLVAFFMGVVVFSVTGVAVVPKFAATWSLVFCFMLVYSASLVLFSLTLSYLTRFKYETEEDSWKVFWKKPRFLSIVIISIVMLISASVTIWLTEGDKPLAEELTANTEINNNNEISIMSDTTKGEAVVKYIYKDTCKPKKCVWDCDSVTKYKSPFTHNP